MSRSLPWAFRSLARSPRVRFATSIGLVMHLLSVLLLSKLSGTRDVPAFIHLVGFIPTVVLVTVAQGNIFGVDRGSTLTALATPVRGSAFLQGRLVASLAWIAGVLLPGWVVGAVLMQGAFVPVFLLQLAFVFLLSAIGGTLSVFAPSSRAYMRTSGQTMSLVALIALNAVSLVAVAGAIRLLSSSAAMETRATLAAACLAIALIVAIAIGASVGRVFETRRDRILDAVKERA